METLIRTDVEGEKFNVMTGIVPCHWKYSCQVIELEVVKYLFAGDVATAVYLNTHIAA